MSAVIRRFAAADDGAWRRLYRAYAAFYRMPMSDKILSEVADWIAGGKLNAYVARADGDVAGFAHWSEIPRPLAGAPVGYLHDLFVAPAHRRKGLARALIAQTAADARARNCVVLRWVTAEDNAAARALYDKVAAKTPWVVYDLKMNAPDADERARG